MFKNNLSLSVERSSVELMCYPLTRRHRNHKIVTSRAVRKGSSHTVAKAEACTAGASPDSPRPPSQKRSARGKAAAPSSSQRVSLPATHLTQLPVEFCGFVFLLSGRVLAEEENQPAAMDKEGIMVPVHICKENFHWYSANLRPKGEIKAISLMEFEDSFISINELSSWATAGFTNKSTWAFTEKRGPTH